MCTALWQCTHNANYCTNPLGNRTTSTTTQYPTQSHYPDSDTDQNCPSPILLMVSARVGSAKYQFCKSLIWPDRELLNLPNRGGAGVCALLIRLPRPVVLTCTCWWWLMMIGGNFMAYWHKSHIHSDTYYFVALHLSERFLRYLLSMPANK